MQNNLKLTKAASDLQTEWDTVADALAVDRMRIRRYEMCLRYIVKLDHNTKIVEIGCGDGQGILLLNRLGFRNVIGAEISVVRLNKAKNLCPSASFVQISPLNQFPFPDSSIDVVVSAAVIEHSVDQAGFISEVSRILRPGGYAIISSDCYSWRILQALGVYRSLQPIDRALFPSTLMRMFEENGFDIEHYEGFPLPGQEYQLIRMPIALLGGFCCKVLRALRIMRSSPSSSTVLTVETAELLLRESILKLSGNLSEFGSTDLMGFLKLVFSNENVFYLRKQL